GDLPFVASQVILKLHPHFGLITDLHFQLVQPARAWTARVADLAIQRKNAVVAWTHIVLPGRDEIDEAPRVRANDIECLDGVRTGAPQINRPDRDRRVSVPS